MDKHEQVLKHREQINLLNKQIELLEDMMEEHYIKLINLVKKLFERM